MPAGKPRRKDDTWTTEDLTQALKGAKDGGEKKKRSRDDDGKERRRAKDDVNGDDGDRRHKDDDKKSRKKDDDRDRKGKGRSRGDYSPTRVALTEEDRERLRQERREKRGGDSKRKEERSHKEEKAAVSDDDAKRKPKREESARRHRKKDDDDDGDRKRRHGEEDGDRKRHRDKESRHRDKEDDDQKTDDDEERERRRRERRERRDKEKKDEDGDKDRKQRSKRDHEDDEEREKRHRDREERRKEKEERHKDRDKDDDRDREKEREERRKDREKDREERHRERDERKRREREEAKRQEEEERRKKEEEKNAGGDDDDYNDYDDDFEDYEDDFENDDDMNEGGRRRKAMAYTLDYESPSRMGYFVKIEEGEMEEVLRALDEENARLTSLSRRSNWSDSTELSDERFKEGEGPNSQQAAKDGDKPKRPRTIINFVSAKQRVMNQSQASKARRRAVDLKNMIELDTVFYDLFDLPPVREYDLYIRSFGRADTKQAYVQTNEDAVERDIQTEEVEDMDKWTQHPAEDMDGVGGDGISVMTAGEENTTLSNPESLARVGKFIEKAAQAMLVLMEEEKTSDEGGGQTRERTSHISLSEGFTQLGCPSFLAGRQVEQMSFCPMQPSVFLTRHSRPQESAEDNVLGCYGIICVWNTKEITSPQKILTCLSQPTCACFSPSRAALVIAGMHDGSVMLWDLREPSSLHRSVFVDDQEITTRFPTYNTAGVLEKENHHSPVIAITAVHPIVVRKENADSSITESEASLSFQLASVEDTATVNLWVVTEIPSPDMAGSEVDLGLAPGGRVKLLRSSAIALNNPNKLVSGGALRALDIQLSPSDLNHFFVTTDMGQIIHGIRFGSRVFPRVYQPEIESPKRITCLDFSPFGEPYFLVGCEDGSVHLYHTTRQHPLSSWPIFSEGHSIITVQWSRSRPAVFFVLADNSTLYTFDLVETGLTPIKTDPVSTGRATALAVGSDPALIGGNKSLPTHMLVALDNGSAELHTVSSTLRQQQPLEDDFIARYMDRF